MFIKFIFFILDHLDLKSTTSKYFLLIYLFIYFRSSDPTIRQTVSTFYFICLFFILDELIFRDEFDGKGLELGGMRREKTDGHYIVIF